MDTLALVLALAAFLTWLAIAAAWFFGVKTMAVLRDWRPPRRLPPLPSLSVVVAARDEEKWINLAVTSILEQDYPDLEVIVVDDRSRDRTSEILERMADSRRTLRVFHVTELPGGWLGKNYALHLGAGHARGDWLLFTDADVIFKPSCLRRAVGYARSKGRDHLTVFPELAATGVFYRAFVLSFALLFYLYSRPWRAKDPMARDSIGAGAFNLLRRSVYETVGTHRAIALRADDDLQLGRLVKRAGFRQEAVFGTGLLEIEWYPGLGEAIRGLEKNALVPFRYRLGLAFLGTGFTFATHVLPPVGLLVADGMGALLFGLAVGLSFLVCSDEARGAGLAGWYGLLHPVGTLLILLATLRAGYMATVRGEIEWRGRRYPVDVFRTR